MTVTKTIIRILKNEYQFHSDTENGTLYDTAVYLNGTLLCTIAGCDMDGFIEELRTLLLSYNI
jgi:hypothetical protein